MAGFQPSRPPARRPRQSDPSTGSGPGHDATGADGDATIDDEGGHE